MSTGIPTNRTNIELDPEVSALIIQKAQEQSAIMSLAQRLSLPGRGLTIPVITSDPEAAWVTETGTKTVSNPGLETKVMQAYKLAVIVPFSEEFRRDMPALTQQIINRLPLALANKFDSTVFHGTAPGSNFDTFAAVNAQAFGDEPYEQLVAADMDIADNNGILNGFVVSPKMRGVLLGATDGNKRPLFINSVAEGAIPMILGQRTVSCKAAYAEGTPSVIGFAGDWSQAYYGVVSDISLTYSDQATLTSGEDTINLWQQNMFAVRAEIEVGFRADTSVFNRFTLANG